MSCAAKLLASIFPVYSSNDKHIYIYKQSPKLNCFPNFTFAADYDIVPLDMKGCMIHPFISKVEHIINFNDIWFAWKLN